MKGLDGLDLGKDEREIGSIISGLWKLVAGISALVAVLVTFTDITFGGFSAKEMTTVLGVLMISAYVIYFSLEEAGERRGEESEEYCSAIKRHKALCAKLTPEMLPELREFLIDYSLEDAAARRRMILLSAGYTEEDLRSYLAGSRMSSAARRVMRRAARIRSVGISPADLISTERPKRRGELYNPEPRARVRMILKLLPTTVCMVMTVSVVLSLKESLGPAEICEGIMKLSTLPVVGIRGYTAGLTYAKEIRAGWINTKSALLEAFLGKAGLTTEA